MDLTHAFAELGLTLRATPAQAKTAYRNLAMRWHPDVNNSPESTARMKSINVAYEVVIGHLALYAACAAAQSQPRAAAPRAEASAGDAAVHAFSQASGFSEFDWRAGFTARPGASSGHAQPEHRSVAVSLFEAAFGCVKRIRGGASDGWTLYVRIHAGTCDGTEVAQADMRVYASVRALPRAFKLSVQIDKHPLFQLNHNRLSVSVPMSIWRWTLGGEFTVPTLEGSARVHLPPRANGVLFKNLGWPHAGQSQLRHPLMVSPKRVYASSLSAQDQRLLQALDTGTRLPEVEGWRLSMRSWAESRAGQSQT